MRVDAGSSGSSKDRRVGTGSRATAEAIETSATGLLAQELGVLISLLFL